MLNGFIIECDGALLSDEKGFRSVDETKERDDEDDSLYCVTRYRSESGHLEIRSIAATYPDLRIVKKWVEIVNVSDKEVNITRVDSACGTLPAGGYVLKYFTGSHGNEFTPESVTLRGTKILEATRGRSSLDIHPWFALLGESGSVLAASIAWSGNWIIRFEPLPSGEYRISAGLSTWEFSKTLRPGETMIAPALVYASLPQGTLEDATLEFGRLCRDHWCPTNDLKKQVATEWNAWQPYQDKDINEDVFKANVDVCATLGIDVCTLDAGWFGTPKLGWYAARGDWDIVNNEKFPSGLKALSDYTRAKGMRFGLWCEIEAVGYGSQVRSTRPDLLARRGEDELWYVCLGNPAAVDWAFNALHALVETYGVDWLKIDFNLDPWAGCNRTDHGHGAGDGLFEHYNGLYELLDRFRAAHPEVIIEGCSGGGGRQDLGIMSRMHLAFLSDLDYSVNGLQIAWGASAMLHPSAWIEFPWSQSFKKESGRNGVSNPIQEDTPRHKLDYIIRIGMLNHFSCSYRLPDWPAWCLERFKEHLAQYKSTISHFVREADFYRLTDQPLRTGAGDNWSAFLYLLPQTREGLLFVFRLAGGAPERVIKLAGLGANPTYTLAFEDSGKSVTMTGRELMEDGLTFSELPEEGSEIVRLTAG